MCNKFITGILAKTVKKKPTAISVEPEDEQKEREVKEETEEKQGMCLFVCSFVRLFVCSFVRLFVCSFVRFVRLFVCSFVRLFVCLECILMEW